MTGSLYTDQLWEDYCAKIEKFYEPKTYQHFDPQFDFPRRKKEIQRLVSDVDAMTSHAFLPLLKVIIKTPRFRYNEKKKKLAFGIKARPISFAGHFDTYLYGFYAYALNQHYQSYIRDRGFEEVVLAYRTDLDGMCNVQFAAQAFRHVQASKECVAITLDIKGYFDSIDHQILKEKWAKVLGVGELPADQYALYRSLTKYAYVNKRAIIKHFDCDIHKKPKKRTLLDYIGSGSFIEKFDLLREHNLVTQNRSHQPGSTGYKRFFGIPQGLAISALLSNIYLIDYDQHMMDKARSEGFYYRRYCDDILIVCDKDQAKEIKESALNEILKYHVQIQEKKTELILFQRNSKGKIRAFNWQEMQNKGVTKLTAAKERGFYKNLQYLGFEFNGQKSYIRASSVSRYAVKMHRRINKTVYMAYSGNGRGNRIFRQQLYHRYSHLGNRNFPRYAYAVAKPYYKNAKGARKEGMNSPTIRRQLRNHWSRLTVTLAEKNLKRIENRTKKGKLRQIKI